MDSLETRLTAVAEELQFAGDWTDRYRLLVQWGEEADALLEHERVEADQVSGCSSPLWLRVRRQGGLLEVKGASPGILPKAMLALVYRLFDGLAEGEGAASDLSVDDLMERLELNRHLSPTRAIVLERMFGRALSGPVEAL